ncbi:hypothetical protein QL285_083032 [Trifolium repens]|nr:hypothetical protein QL285_083032 [Trifolium repens]
MMQVPWLGKLLAITAFFTTCEVHSNDRKNERNMFCIDCIDNPFCGSCIKTSHKDHNVIQIRRSSYSEVVKTTEIYKHVDILGIQTYVINNSSVVFLSKRTRPHPKRNNICKIGHTSNSHCKTCDRNLVDSSFFCSLACKFAFIKKDGGFFVNPKEMEEMERLLEESVKVSPSKEKAKSFREQNLKRKADEAGIDEENEEDEEKKEEENKESSLLVNRPSTSFRKPNSRRKGIPHRAPFF